MAFPATNTVSFRKLNKVVYKIPAIKKYDFPFMKERNF